MRFTYFRRFKGRSEGNHLSDEDVKNVKLGSQHAGRTNGCIRSAMLDSITIYMEFTSREKGGSEKAAAEVGQEVISASPVCRNFAEVLSASKSTDMSLSYMGPGCPNFTNSPTRSTQQEDNLYKGEADRKIKTLRQMITNGSEDMIRTQLIINSRRTISELVTEFFLGKFQTQSREIYDIKVNDICSSEKNQYFRVCAHLTIHEIAQGYVFINSRLTRIIHVLNTNGQRGGPTLSRLIRAETSRRHECRGRSGTRSRKKVTQFYAIRGFAATNHCAVKIYQLLFSQLSEDSLNLTSDTNKASLMRQLGQEII
ncbi:hypothetical protein ANN_20836 [Periplaneta americana]|uniref:Uncharacterized protein n=1 Tax=Periplaneta americana TaxID=6978 RepID=A0ABQ8SDV5_PERAM|nr:hypothetical protein ANN_20836 [Periplaneta americana]